MYLLYSFLLTLGLVILLPRFVVDAFRAGKYVTGLRERLGSLPLPENSESPLIWLHCVSVGETEAARPLVRSLKQNFPNHRLAISTTTVTGQQVARSAFPQDAVAIFYFPVDWTWTVRRVLRTLRPSAVVIMETELWPNLLRECHRQSIPTALVNGRISETSFRRYRWIRSFMRHVLSHLSVAIMQSDADATRLRELGMPADRILMYGNLKFDGVAGSEKDRSTADAMRRRFALNESKRVIVAASTHEPEESIIVDAFKALAQTRYDQSLCLIIAPRHPERFDEVARQLNGTGMKWARRSHEESADDANARIILIDSIGELRAAYALADVAFVGGSVAALGGHNVLEPASQGVCVITGPHMNNFAAIMMAFLARDAIVQLPNVPFEQMPEVLASTLGSLLDDAARRHQIANSARGVCEANRGATERTIQTLGHLLTQASATTNAISFSTLQPTAIK